MLISFVCFAFTFLICTKADMAWKSVFVFVDMNQISHVNEKDGFLTVQKYIYCFYTSQLAACSSAEFGNQ